MISYRVFTKDVPQGNPPSSCVTTRFLPACGWLLWRLGDLCHGRSALFLFSLSLLGYTSLSLCPPLLYIYMSLLWYLCLCLQPTRTPGGLPDRGRRNTQTYVYIWICVFFHPYLLWAFGIYKHIDIYIYIYIYLKIFIYGHCEGYGYRYIYICLMYIWASVFSTRTCMGVTYIYLYIHCYIVVYLYLYLDTLKGIDTIDIHICVYIFTCGCLSESH